MRFQAFLCNQPLDFSDFWYGTSLIYYFEYCTGSFARQIMFSTEKIKRYEECHIIPHDHMSTYCSKNVAGM